jgi:hypothetical protein
MADFKVSVRHEDEHVVLIIAGGKGVKVPWGKADAIARALTQCARKAEEYAKANKIIYDNALIQRAGFPIGLSDHPKIKAETVKESLYNRNLRRWLPKTRKGVDHGMGGIQSRGSVGAPGLSKTYDKVS